MAPMFTRQELASLREQRLGRLATVDAAGAPQSNPVGFTIDEANGTMIIGGTALQRTRKFRNARRNANVALVVDDLASTDPWVVRGVEVRGRAEALVDVDPPMRGMSCEVLRITPTWIGSWGIDPADPTFHARSA
jgi:pyridoxamine 5'-phosphate oxidase family protein